MKIPVTELVARLRTDPIDDVQAGQLLEAAANRIEELEAQLAAPVAAQEPTPTDRYVDSCHRAVERLTAALHVATLRAHPHMTHAEIQAEIVRIARTPAPAADGAQGERQPATYRKCPTHGHICQCAGVCAFPVANSR